MRCRRPLDDTQASLADTVRAFLAVPVAPPAHRAVGELVAGLRRRVDGVRWVDPATVHLTLHFFAALPAAELETIAALIRPVALATRRFPVDLGGIGSFPSRSRPRVLWLGLRLPSTDLGHLALAVQDVLARNGQAVELRPLRAHVTLGRPGPGFDAQAWRRELADPFPIPEFTAAEVILYESVGGHHPRARLPLAA